MWCYGGFKLPVVRRGCLHKVWLVQGVSLEYSRNKYRNVGGFAASVFEFYSINCFTDSIDGESVHAFLHKVV